MPVPTLTPSEIVQLQRELAIQQSYAQSLTDAVPAKAQEAANYGIEDGAFKKFFDYYNDDIIGKYDAERKAINGVYIAAPITEADVQGPANLNGAVRTTPTMPVTNVVRVTEFDGGGLTSTNVHELQHIADQAVREDRLVNGFSSSAGFDSSTAETTSILTASSTTLDVEDLVNPLTIVIGDHLYISDGTNFAIITITSVTDNLGGNPPYDFTYGITFIYAPAAPIATGIAVKDYVGFTDSERTTKTPVDPDYQVLMNTLISELEGYINDRIARLNEQLAAITTNFDPDAVTELASAAADVNVSKTFLTNYLVTTDISDVGLATLASERASRTTETTNRLAQIAVNYTGQTDNYYDKRYEIANNRANTSRGTLRLQLATQAQVSQLGSYAADATAFANAIQDLLP